MLVVEQKTNNHILSFNLDGSLKEIPMKANLIPIKLCMHLMHFIISSYLVGSKFLVVMYLVED